MSKKRRRDQVEPDALPGQDDEIITDSHPEPPPKKSKGQLKQEKSERRAKKNTKKSHNADQPETEDADTAADRSVPEKSNDGETPAKERREKKKTKQKNKSVNAEAGDQPQSTKAPAPARFVVFVGNLPFDATADQVKEHFVKLAPSSVRLSTDKATGKGKGFAFVEFDGYDKMKTCLKLYHHSIFDPTRKNRDDDVDESQRKGRRINVELTAGGGGKKSKERGDRIREKNKKLNEQRERARLNEMAEKQQSMQKKRERPQTGANTAEPDHGSIHPSRLANMGRPR